MIFKSSRGPPRACPLQTNLNARNSNLHFSMQIGGFWNSDCVSLGAKARLPEHAEVPTGARPPGAGAGTRARSRGSSPRARCAGRWCRRPRSSPRREGPTQGQTKRGLQRLADPVAPLHAQRSPDGCGLQEENPRRKHVLSLIHI